MRYLFSVSTAAVLYVLPFYFPHALWWLVCTFPLPVLLYGVHHQFSFWYGYLFGFFSLAGHLQGVFSGVFKLAQGAWYIKLIPFFFILCYQALFSGLFFWCWQKIALFRSNTVSYHTQIGVAILALYSFVMYLDKACLTLFDRWEGYFFTNPLILFAQVPFFLIPLSFVGRWIMTFCVIATPGILCMRTSMRLVKLIWFLFIVIMYGYAFVRAPLSRALPEWHRAIAALPVEFPPNYNLTFLVSSVAVVLKNYIQKKGTYLKVVVMPESSLYCEVLAMPTLSALWSAQAVGATLHIFAGAFRWKGTAFHNSLHWVYDGILQKCFDKRHAMVLTERLPQLFRFSFLQKLFFLHMPEITPSKKQKKYSYIAPGWAMVPYICSELFFNDTPDDMYPEFPILAVCNDRLLAPYVAHLMLLAARYRAIEWNRMVVYVSFRYQQFLLPSGAAHEMERITVDVS